MVTTAQGIRPATSAWVSPSVRRRSLHHRPKLRPVGAVTAEVYLQLYHLADTTPGRRRGMMSIDRYQGDEANERRTMSDLTRGQAKIGGFGFLGGLLLSLVVAGMSASASGSVVSAVYAVSWIGLVVGLVVTHRVQAPKAASAVATVLVAISTIVNPALEAVDARSQATDTLAWLTFGAGFVLLAWVAAPYAGRALRTVLGITGLAGLGATVGVLTADKPYAVQAGGEYDQWGMAAFGLMLVWQVWIGVLLLRRSRSLDAEAPSQA